jgi:hypothetical protein
MGHVKDKQVKENFGVSVKITDAKFWIIISKAVGFGYKIISSQPTSSILGKFSPSPNSRSLLQFYKHLSFLPFLAMTHLEAHLLIEVDSGMLFEDLWQICEVVTEEGQSSYKSWSWSPASRRLLTSSNRMPMIYRSSETSATVSALTIEFSWEDIIAARQLDHVANYKMVIMLRNYVEHLLDIDRELCRK